MFKKNTAVTGFSLGLVSATDGSAITTGTPVGYTTLDGGTQTAIGDVTPVHEGNGQWSFDLTAGEMNGDIVGLVFTHASAIPVHFTIKTDTKITSELNDIAATAIVSGGAINTTTGAVDSVTLTATTTDVTNQVTADMTAISGDTVAADNLELQFDGTGYVDDTAPSTQAQLSGIANVGSAVHVASSSYTLTTGVQSVGTFAATEALDGSYHTHTDTAGVMDLEYHFLIGGGTPSSIQVSGYVTGANDDIDVFGYDWVTAGYKQIGNMNGSSSTSNSVYSFDMFVNMVGTGANRGKVDVMFGKTSGLSTAVLAIDQAFVAYSQGVEGYEHASIWYDDSASNTGTIIGVDGTASNPVSTEAAVQTLLTNTNYSGIVIKPGSTYTAAAAHNNLLIHQHGATLALGGQSFNDTHVFDGAVSGVATAATGEMEFHQCEVGTASVQTAHFYDCTFDGTVTLTLAADYHVIKSQSGVAGSGSPTFTKTAGQTITLEVRKWSGGITISGLEAGDVLSIEGMFGTITLNGADATVEIRGSYKGLTNNLTGSPTVNIDGAWIGADIASTLADTNELQGDWADGGRLDLILDIIAADTTTDIPALISGLNDLDAAAVNAEVVDALATDTYAESSAVPAATASLAAKIQWLATLARNKVTQTATTQLVRNDADSATLGTSTVSDDGTTFTRGEFS